VILAAGVIRLFVRSWRYADQRRSVDIVLLSLVLVPVVVFSFNWTVPYPHYFILIMPAAFTILAISLVDLFGWVTQWNRLQKAYLVSATLLAGLILVGQVLYWERLIETLNSRYTPDGFGVPLGRLMDIRQAVLHQAPDQVIANVNGLTIGVDDGPSVWNFLLADIEQVRFIDERTKLLSSTGTALLLSNSCPIGEQGLTYPLREPAEGCYRLTDYPWQVVTIPSDAQSLSNGVQILKATWDSVSGCIEIDWAISQPPSQDYFFKVHLMGSDGNRVAIADGPAWPGQFWLPGDTLQSQYCVPANTDISSIVSTEIGMYTYDGVTFGNVDVLDSAGNPTGQSIHVAFQ
jgi:hypothetical protein